MSGPEGVRRTGFASIRYVAKFGAAGLVATLMSVSVAWAECREDRIDLRDDGGSARFTVEIADDDAERSLGLMYREEMAEGHGMLFLFDPPRPVSFWMRNTPLPLDLIFIDSEGRVLNVLQGKPFSEEAIPSEGTAKAVLEVNAGLMDRYGMGRGTEARHPAFGQGAAWPCE